MKHKVRTGKAAEDIDNFAIQLFADEKKAERVIVPVEALVYELPASFRRLHLTNYAAQAILKNDGDDDIYISTRSRSS